MNYEGFVELKFGCDGVTKGDDDELRVETRVEFEAPLSNEAIDAIPVISQAVRQLLKASRAIEDGEKNSVKLSAKFDWLPYTYSLKQGDSEVQFTAAIAGGRPTVHVVEGEVYARWKVDTKILPDDITKLSLMTGEPIDLVSESVQGDLVELAS